MKKKQISLFILENFKLMKKWLKIQTIYINENKLNLKKRKHYKFLIKKFINYFLKKFYDLL
ncbi:Fe(2+)-trafficking protein [Candidatus Vidania fulgoroideorum]